METKTCIGKKEFKIFDEELILVSILPNKELLLDGGFEVIEVDEAIAYSEALKICEEFENE